MRQVINKRVHCIKIVLGQGERTGSGRGPGVHQRCLNYLETSVRPPNKRTAVLNDDFDFRSKVQIVALLRKPLPPDHIRDDGIDFNAYDLFASGGKGARDVPPTTGPDDQGFSGWS